LRGQKNFIPYKKEFKENNSLSQPVRKGGDVSVLDPALAWDVRCIYLKSCKGGDVSVLDPALAWDVRCIYLFSLCVAHLSLEMTALFIYLAHRLEKEFKKLTKLPFPCVPDRPYKILLAQWGPCPSATPCLVCPFYLFIYLQQNSLAQNLRKPDADSRQARHRCGLARASTITGKPPEPPKRLR